VRRQAALWFPIMVFAASGFEHAIANMAFVPMGLMYGADADYGRWLYQNLLLVIAGNIVGGGLVVGGAAYFLFGWARLLDGAERQQTDLLRRRRAGEAAAAAKPDRGLQKEKTAVDKDLEARGEADRDGAGSQQSGAARRRRRRAAALRRGSAATPPPDPARVRALFASFDGDGDGLLDTQELPCALHALGFRYRLALLLAAAHSSAFADSEGGPGASRAGCGGRGGGEGVFEALFDLRAFEAAVRRLRELEGLGLRESESGHGPAARLERLATC
jgi:hypothetical protein